MIEKVLSKMGGAGMIGVIAICLFFAAFIGVIVWTLCLKKRDVNEMKNLPLQDDSPSASDTAPDAKPKERHD